MGSRADLPDLSQGGAPLEICLLGELEVRRAGKAVALPASRKTRALLGYLVATGKAQPRNHLCDLFWADSDDPRAALRWSLNKLRPIVDEATAARLRSEGDRVAFAPQGALVDLTALQQRIGADCSRVPTEALASTITYFRGEFLEGLDLPGCYHYHAWCMAERARLRTLRTSMLAILVERFSARPETALRYARERCAVDPFDEQAHIALIRLLGDLGRKREALAQYEDCRRILERELGALPSAALERARVALGADRAAAEPAPSAPVPTVAAAGNETRRLIGRRSERARIDQLIEAASRSEARGLLLFTGEPGVGKTRLLEELAARMRAVGGITVGGRFYEAEIVRPYGAWIDALRGIPTTEIPQPLHADLALLLPELGPPVAEGTERSRLFDAVSRLLAGLATRAPVAVILDDIQWGDEASIALLSFAVRSLERRRMLFACAARPGELEDNAAVMRALGSWTRNDLLAEVSVGPLDAADTAELAHTVAPDLDGAQVFAEAAGNPLLALEVSRALKECEQPRSARIEALLAARFGRLSERGRSLVAWAAVFGRSFTPEALSRASGFAPADLMATLSEAERYAILRSTPGGEYDFAHDLVRSAAYRSLSEARRRLAHREVARALWALDDETRLFAGDVAHHAIRGGDAELAATACAEAGERCRRLFAYREATQLAERGLAQAAGLPRSKRLPLEIELLGLRIHSGVSMAEAEHVEAALSRAVLEAQEAGMQAQAQRGLYWLSMLHYYRGDAASAHADTVRAAEAGRGADPATAARAFAATARCLAHLGREMDRAQALLLEAKSIAEPLGLDILDLSWGLGMVRHFAGDTDEAARLLSEALAKARRKQDRWPEWDCLARLTMIDLERGRAREALKRCRELQPISAKMGEGSEIPFAETLEALAKSMLGETEAEASLEQALVRLRAADTKGQLAYALTLAAQLDAERGAAARAQQRLEEAIHAAEVVERHSEGALARALLARLAPARGGNGPAAACLDEFSQYLGTPLGLSSRARAALASLEAQIGEAIPTAATTPGA
jgi:DNA-binding SARP family transcriptional activator